MADAGYPRLCAAARFPHLVARWWCCLLLCSRFTWGQQAVIRDVAIVPVTCDLQPASGRTVATRSTAFDPLTKFYLVQCPTQASNVSISWASAFHLSWADDGRDVPKTAQVHLAIGQSKPLVIKACTEATPASCTQYTFVVHRMGSSEALLNVLSLIASGVTVPPVLTPEFAPEVRNYRVEVPYGATLQVTARAKSGGFVCIDSCEAVQRHHFLTKDVQLNASILQPKPVIISVNSSDDTCQAKYTVQVVQMPNSDASLKKISASMGVLQPPFDPAVHQYRLNVPKGTEKVAVSATATDAHATVTVIDRTDVGYSASIVNVPRGSAFGLANIRVRAADRKGYSEYSVVVLSVSNGEEAALLQSLIVWGCVGGLRPGFQMFVHDYLCPMDDFAEKVAVMPTALWLPGENEHATLSIAGQQWRNGAKWVQPLDDKTGKATINILVRSADGKRAASYTVAAVGLPLAQRATTATTTTTTSTTTTSTTVTDTFTDQYGLVVYSTTGYPEEHVTTETRTTTAPTVAPGGFNLTLPGMPLMPGKLSIPSLPPLSSFVPPFWFASLLVVSSSWLMLALCDGLAACMALLKQLQLIALTASHAPPKSHYRMLAQQYGSFNLWITFPVVSVRKPTESDFAQTGEGEDVFAEAQEQEEAFGEAPEHENAMDISPEHEFAEHEERKLAEEIIEDPTSKITGRERDQETEQWLVEAQSRIGNLSLLVSSLPLLLFLFACGWKVAAREEFEAEDTPMSDAGLKGIRTRMLPSVLCIFDVALIGFADSLAAFICAPIEVMVESSITEDVLRVNKHMLALMFLTFPIGFIAFAIVKLSMLRGAGRLVFSNLLGLFADARTLAVALRGPSYTAWPPRYRDLGVLSSLFASEFRSVVPLQAVEGGSVQLSNVRGAKQNRPKANTGVPGDLEMQLSLLGSKANPVAPWRRRQEQLGLLHWMERRCAAYEALKEQIQCAERNGVITEACGLQPIFDAKGELLIDLYQYCIYQFPSRPWLNLGTTIHPTVYEPLEMEGGGLKASWVPAAREIGARERTRIDSWLNNWLVEAETASRTREELRMLQVRGYDPAATQEEQGGLLREMALALLEELPPRQPRDFSPEESEDREGRLDELVSDALRSGTGPPWRFEIDPVGPQEAIARLNADFVNLDELWMQNEVFMHPSLLNSAFGVKRLFVRTIGEDTGVNSIGATSSSNLCDGASVVSTRMSLTALPLYLAHLRLLARWMPPFSFSIPYESLRLPVREHWLPLFPSASGPGAPPRSLPTDVLERLCSVLAVLAARSVSLTPHAHLAPLAFAAWWLAAFFLRRCTGRSRWIAFRGTAVQFILCCLVPMFWIPKCWPRFCLAQAIDNVCIIFVAAASLIGAWSALQQHFAIGPVQTALRPIVKSDAEAPEPPFGHFVIVGSVGDGRPLPLAFAVPLLGLFIESDPCYNVHACTDEQRFGSCQKRLALYQAPPTRGTYFERPSLQLKELKNFAEIRDIMPMVLTRAQLASTEEIRELVCTIHVVNHAGCDWSCLANDSFMSIYKPWGLDSRPSGSKESSSITGSDARTMLRGASLAADSPALIKAWQAEVADWLHGELGASGTAEYTAQDVMMYGGGAWRGAIKQEGDRRVVPGLFSDECLGATKFSNSRCYQDGLVLHYVIPSSELKPRLSWSPDPLAAHLAELNTHGKWRSCLLRLCARGIRYFLRKIDGENFGGIFPDWQEPLWCDHGDLVEYSVPFAFVGSVAVDVEDCQISFNARELRRPDATIDPAPTDQVPRAMPLTFAVSEEMAEIWAFLVNQFGMTGRQENIANYTGPIKEHANIPNCVYRHGEEGEQLWDDNKRYAGAWQNHVYHGYGQLLGSGGETIYRGQWQQGMKHGQGVFTFKQGTVRREYDGQWVQDEFSGEGVLRVLDEYIEQLRQNQPHSIVSYRGRFAVANGQFMRAPDLATLDPDKHQRFIDQYFPTGKHGSNFLQYCGSAPQDFASQYYGLDGNDIRHCGPDPRTLFDEGPESVTCEILYGDGTTYRGPCAAAAIPHGDDAMLVEPNGTTYEGSFTNGLRAGIGRVSLPNGISYDGDFLYPGGQMHGHGTLLVPEGLQGELGIDMYVGQHRGGLRHGDGKLTLPGGAVYDGSFVDNQRHGHGSFTSKNGDARYWGPWESDRPGVGDADASYPSGYRYVGEMTAGVRGGDGRLLDASGGDVYTGHWSNDDPNGPGTLYCVEGEYKGLFASGVKQGQGRFLWRAMDGDYLYEGQFSADQPHGIGTYTEPDGFVHTDVQVVAGEFTSSRKPPPPKGIKDKYLKKAPLAPKLDIRVPATPKDWPRSRTIFTSGMKFSTKLPASMEAINVGSGVAHGRSRPAHMGVEGVPGSRWQ